MLTVTYLALAYFFLPDGRKISAIFLLTGLGLGAYVYLPLASETNPPMNWGYARTWEGFIHAITRAQYAKIDPTNPFSEKFFLQLGMYFTDLRRQFTLPIALLGFLPLLESDLVDPQRLIADAKSGVSGAGRKTALATQLCEAGDNFKAYSVTGHRHHAEIVQCLSLVTGHDIGVTFVPHLVPMLRGIHATLYARLTRPDVDLQEVYERRYREEPFVDVMPPGSHPDTRSVRGANVCRIAWHRPGGGDTVVVLSVEDNLVKGAAGQAVQNMNIMFGIDERLGLGSAALVP